MKLFIRSCKDEKCEVYADTAHGNSGWLLREDGSWIHYIYDEKQKKWVSLSDFRENKRRLKQERELFYKHHPHQLRQKIRAKKKRHLGSQNLCTADVGR